MSTVSRKVWQDREREVIEYLDGLQPNERPIPFAYWCTIWGMSTKNGGHTMFAHMPATGTAYRQRLTEWRQDLIDDVAAFYVPGQPSVDRVALASKYHDRHEWMNRRVDLIQSKLRRKETL